jgi:Flp pilus assembly protein CpaB
MMRPTTLLLLIVVLGTGVGSGLGLYFYLQPTEARRVHVVVAAQDIEPGGNLSEQNLRVAEFPEGTPLPGDAYYVFSPETLANEFLKEDSKNAERVRGNVDVAKEFLKSLKAKNRVPANAIVDKNELYNKPAKEQLAKEEVLTKHSLAEAAGLASQIESGKRAFAIKVNESDAVAGFIQHGSVVDVLYSPRETKERAKVYRLLQNVKVLAVNYEFRGGKGQETGQPVSSVTVLVTPKEEQILRAAMNTGSLALGLRNPADPSVETEHFEITLEEALNPDLKKAEPKAIAGSDASKMGPVLPKVPALPVVKLTKPKDASAEPELPPQPETVVVQESPKKVLVYRDVLTGKSLLEIPIDEESEIGKTPAVRVHLQDAPQKGGGRTPALPTLPPGSVSREDPEKSQSQKESPKVK